MKNFEIVNDKQNIETEAKIRRQVSNATLEAINLIENNKNSTIAHEQEGSTQNIEALINEAREKGTGRDDRPQVLIRDGNPPEKNKKIKPGPALEKLEPILTFDLAFEQNIMAEYEDRTKAKDILSIIRLNLGVDINDGDQLTLVSSNKTNGVIGYDLIYLPEWQRAIYVCDEEDEATFVLDTSYLQEKDVLEQLIGRRKTEIRKLARNSPEQAKVIRELNDYLKRVETAIRHPLN